MPFRRALAVFVKAPVPGAVKSRLTPVLSPEEAAGLYRAFVGDSLDTVAQWAELSPSHRPFLAYAGHWRHPDPRWTGFAGPVFPQTEGDLGARLADAFARLFESGAHAATVIGSDAPEIGVDRLVEAFQALEEQDAVLGPAADGGYYLLGLRRPAPELFVGIPWSTGEVLSETIARMDRLGLRHKRLEALADIDTPEDLARLARRLREPGARCPLTRAALDKLKTGRIP